MSAEAPPRAGAVVALAACSLAFAFTLWMAMATSTDRDLYALDTSADEGVTVWTAPPAGP